jgi:glycosyltransferase involved in cell wall biosynthesis
MRIKDESRWIVEVLESILPVCEKVFILDDHSTDGTVELCRSFNRVTVLESPFEGVDEARDKTWLMAQVLSVHDAEWVLMIDGDEVLESAGPQKIRRLLQYPLYEYYSFNILYLWNDAHTVRRDGVYGSFKRPSLFRVQPNQLPIWKSTNYGGNFHCSNIPSYLMNLPYAASEINLYHYGYIDASLRERKYRWYNQIDPNNLAEDCYRHTVQGDPCGPPADMKLLHAGPLRLERI